MDSYRTEDEQIQAIKNWWKENGVSTVLTLCVAVAAVFGWRGWQDQQQQKLDEAAVTYQSMLEAFAQADAAPDDIKIASALYLADTIKTDFSNSGYAYFAALLKAKQAIADEDFSAAETELRWVIDNAPSGELTTIAQLRLARVLVVTENPEAALALLDLATVEDNDSNPLAAFVPQKAELAGDIYMSLDEHQQAHEMYLLAQSSAEKAGIAMAPLLVAKMGYAKSYL